MRIFRLAVVGRGAVRIFRNLTAHAVHTWRMMQYGKFKGKLVRLRNYAKLLSA
jgi:hypothetical protein